MEYTPQWRRESTSQGYLLRRGEDRSPRAKIPRRIPPFVPPNQRQPGQGGRRATAARPGSARVGCSLEPLALLLADGEPYELASIRCRACKPTSGFDDVAVYDAVEEGHGVVAPQSVWLIRPDREGRQETKQVHIVCLLALQGSRVPCYVRKHSYEAFPCIDPNPDRQLQA